MLILTGLNQIANYLLYDLMVKMQVHVPSAILIPHTTHPDTLDDPHKQVSTFDIMFINGWRV